MKHYEFFPYRQPTLLRKKSPFWVHLVLFLATFLTTTIAGAQWVMKNYYDISNWHYGLLYAILIMTFLTSHEMGHYIASKIHKVDASLPYFIPVPFPELMLFGTFGAVIATRSPIPNRKVLFDIGISGPLSGFIVSMAFLIFGLVTLPPKEFIYSIHPEYLLNYGGEIPNTGLTFGNTLLYSILTKIFANPNGWLPPMNEIYHYPFLCVGWFGLFVTIINLLPFGQLDGGHIIYSMFGNKQYKIAKFLWWTMIIYGLGSLFNSLYELFYDIDLPYKSYIFLQNSLLPVLKFLKEKFPFWMNAWGGWLFWGLVVKLFIKLPHPYIPTFEPLGTFRTLLGYIAILILILSFPPYGIYFK